ncbi:Hypothetical protein PEIBARAKI_5357 [Petrimonas sp. IBARAKI]|nr:Hypothetical protein PEIBARAKI_5357 [Petrimonas sp. IBARAKI]
MSELFQRERTVITKHINKIYSWKKTHNFLTISLFYPNNRYISSINPFVSLHNKLIEAGLLYFRHIDLLTKEE